MNQRPDPHYPRDLAGYGRTPPDPQWPGGAAIAVQFVLNYEEGGENNVLDGDPASETFLSEMTPAEAFPDRHMSMESLYEYGSRAGLWRLLDVFSRRGVPLTVFAVARAQIQRDHGVDADAKADGNGVDQILQGIHQGQRRHSVLADAGHKVAVYNIIKCLH